VDRARELPALRSNGWRPLSTDERLWGLSPAFVWGVMLFAVLVNCLGVNLKAIVTNDGWLSDCWIGAEGMKFKYG